jgi:septal ring factor EnvC (AmiA/AmiB activator)
MVQAVHEGEVTFAGYLRGYGNTVIVNHGYKYYSINSRIERILVKKGQKVTEQTDIAIMGDTATLMNEGLYFEIRHDDETLDPLDWLDNTQLTFSQ